MFVILGCAFFSTIFALPAIHWKTVPSSTLCNEPCNIDSICVFDKARPTLHACHCPNKVDVDHFCDPIKLAPASSEESEWSTTVAEIIAEPTSIADKTSLTIDYPVKAEPIKQQEVEPNEKKTKCLPNDEQPTTESEAPNEFKVEPAFSEDKIESKAEVKTESIEPKKIQTEEKIEDKAELKMDAEINAVQFCKQPTTATWRENVLLVAAILMVLLFFVNVGAIVIFWVNGQRLMRHQCATSEIISSCAAELISRFGITIKRS
jgi:hypothetical protein